MPIQLNKAVLEQNIFTKANQTLTITGLGRMLILSRDAITLEQPTIELADKTNVPGGRNNPGEFNCVVQLAHDDMRRKMISWYHQCLNYGNGVNPNYKKPALLTFNRHFQGAPDAQFGNGSSARNPLNITILGTWPKSCEIPEYSMSDGDDGDADCQLTLNLSYDDLEFESGEVDALGALSGYQSSRSVTQNVAGNVTGFLGVGG
jgi:hypothetical protein